MSSKSSREYRVVEKGCYNTFITLRKQGERAFSSFIVFCDSHHLLVFVTILKDLEELK